jgi:hypothetical protein
MAHEGTPDGMRVFQVGESMRRQMSDAFCFVVGFESESPFHLIGRMG